MSEPETGRPLPITYPGLLSVPIVLANQFVIQQTPDGFILTVAQVAPPILVGSPEDRQSALNEIEEAPATVVARIALTRQRVDELAELLRRHLQRDADERDPASESDREE